MNATINELVKSIVKKNSLAECSVSELQRLTTQYPYFGPVQFLLARKLKEDNSPLYGKQSQKAILFFHDQLWFEFVTSTKDNTAVITHGKQYTAPVEVSAPAEIMLKEEIATALVEQEEVVNQSYVDTNPPAESIIEAKEEMILPVSSEQLHTAAEECNDFKEEQITEVAQFDAAPPAEIVTEWNEEKIIEPISSEQLHVAVEESNDFKEEQITEVAQFDAAPPVEIVTESNEEKIIEPISSGQLYETSEQSTEVEEEEYSEVIQEGQQMPALPALKIEPLNADAKLTFEPYHTIDYFASQGVRFKEEEKPKDKFGQQLKSFTEWLKAMKRLPDVEITAQPVVTEDKKVTQLAEHSLADREVVTEAMADVWEQQGNNVKAIETYRKLSLLNPAKSGYFAAKIEHLKRL